jgi:Family of unknown function (DUF6949)
MSPESVQSLLSLAIGFAVAGLIASSYQLATTRPLSFRLFAHPERATAVAAVPMLVLAAPFIIMRNTIRGRQLEQRRAELVALATVLAGFWSLMSGTVVVALLQALGLLLA